MTKALRFLQITAEYQVGQFFYRISNHKGFIPKYDNALTDLPKLDEHRGSC